MSREINIDELFNDEEYYTEDFKYIASIMQGDYYRYISPNKKMNSEEMREYQREMYEG